MIYPTATVPVNIDNESPLTKHQVRPVLVLQADQSNIEGGDGVQRALLSTHNRTREMVASGDIA